MTKKEFLKELAKLKGFMVCPGPYYWIRQSPTSYCPLEAVAKSKDQFIGRGTDHAVARLHIRRSIAEKIVVAADNQGEEKTRKQLMKACHLPERRNYED